MGAAPERVMQRRVFALTAIGYAVYYFTRKNLSVVKKTLETRQGISRAALGDIETGYLLAYALGQIVWGMIGDRRGPKRLLVLGLAGSAACAVGFGFSSAAAGFAVFFAANGVLQSTGWPSAVGAMSSWYPAQGRGRIMGLWATNSQVGSLLANLIAAGCALAGWRYAFFGPALLVAAMAVAIALWLPARGPIDPPRAPGAPPAPPEERRRALASPVVWGVGAAYFFLKLTRYVLLFWLPYFMEDSLGYSTLRAAIVSLCFEAGGALGSIAIGWVSDRTRGRLGPAFVALVGLALALPLYGWAASRGLAWNVCTLGLVGFLLYGPDTLLSGAVAQDLGGPGQAATAAGVINGLGSLGPIVQGRLTSSVSTRFGWRALFGLLGVTALVSALVVVAIALLRRARVKSA
jgi:sugar phosphate permease